jgi:hypothetical protein
MRGVYSWQYKLDQNILETFPTCSPLLAVDLLFLAGFTETYVVDQGDCEGRAPPSSLLQFLAANASFQAKSQQTNHNQQHSGTIRKAHNRTE